MRHLVALGGILVLLVGLLVWAWTHRPWCAPEPGLTPSGPGNRARMTEPRASAPIVARRELAAATQKHHAHPRSGAQAPSQDLTQGPGLPLSIDALLARSNLPPRFVEVPRLEAADQARLIRLYGEIPNLAAKQHLVHILVFRGDGEVVPLLVRALTTEYADRQLDVREETFMTFLPTLLGILARQHDEALQFLQEGCDPLYWRAQKRWQGPAKDAEHDLAVASLAGLGMSGRPEAWETFIALREDRAATASRRLESGVTEAVYRWRMVETHGLEVSLDKVLVTATTAVKHLVAWMETPEGAAWEAWRVQCEALRR